MCLYTIEATDYCIKCFDYLQRLQSTAGSTPVVNLVIYEKMSGRSIEKKVKFHYSKPKGCWCSRWCIS